MSLIKNSSIIYSGYKVELFMERYISTATGTERVSVPPTTTTTMPLNIYQKYASLIHAFFQRTIYGLLVIKKGKFPIGLIFYMTSQSEAVKRSFLSIFS